MAKGERTILVTGAAGCIGAWVVATLARAGRQVLAFDLSDDRRRLRLILDEQTVDDVPWVVGDIADATVVERTIAENEVGPIIHLAALQVPFCRADPIAGARVNVVGQVNVLEAARRSGINSVVYASSVAALPLVGGEQPSTLYGVYKAADEGISRVYWQDWGVPSIGLRPHTVYGPGRDQGLTSAPTKAMLAAAAGRRYEIPFTGGVLMQYTAEVAEIFIRCADADVETAAVFDLGGPPVTIDEIRTAIAQVAPECDIQVSGDPLPFRATFDDGPLRVQLGEWQRTPLDVGVTQTVAAFRDLLSRGLVSADDL